MRRIEFSPEQLRDLQRNLRDRFAVAALSNSVIVQAAFGIERDPRPPDYVAKYCYEMADAMLKEREKNG